MAEYGLPQGSGGQAASSPADDEGGEADADDDQPWAAAKTSHHLASPGGGRDPHITIINADEEDCPELPGAMPGSMPSFAARSEGCFSGRMSGRLSETSRGSLQFFERPAGSVSLQVPGGHSPSEGSISRGVSTSSFRRRESKRRQSLASKSQVLGNLASDEPVAIDSPFLRWSKTLQEVTRSTWFESVFACMIMANTIVLMAEVQYDGIAAGYELGFVGSTNTAEEAWPGAGAAFEVLEVVFGVAFAVELAINLIAWKLELFKEIWGWLDCMIVFFWALGVLFDATLPLDPTMIRLVRLVRLLRMLRLVRTIKGFDSLYLLTTALKASISALMWSTILVLLVQMTIALILNQLLQSYILDEANPEERRHVLFTYFGTFSRSMLTMFELALANWPDPSRPLTEYVSEWYVFFVLGYQLVVGFAVVRVIMGVFLQVTFDVASTDDVLMVNQKERAMTTDRNKMAHLFNVADDDGSGFLDQEEFRDIVQDPLVAKWMAAMECDVSLFAGDPDVLYSLVDNGDGRITVEELVAGVARMKGPARSIDMAMLMHENREIRKSLQELLSSMATLQKQRAMADGKGPLEPPGEGLQLGAAADAKEDPPPAPLMSVVAPSPRRNSLQLPGQDSPRTPTGAGDGVGRSSIGIPALEPGPSTPKSPAAGRSSIRIPTVEAAPSTPKSLAAGRSSIRIPTVEAAPSTPKSLAAGRSSIKIPTLEAPTTPKTTAAGQSSIKLPTLEAPTTPKNLAAGRSSIKIPTWEAPTTPKSPAAGRSPLRLPTAGTPSTPKNRARKMSLPEIGRMSRKVISSHLALDSPRTPVSVPSGRLSVTSPEGRTSKILLSGIEMGASPDCCISPSRALPAALSGEVWGHPPGRGLSEIRSPTASRQGSPRSCFSGRLGKEDVSSVSLSDKLKQHRASVSQNLFEQAVRPAFKPRLSLSDELVHLDGNFCKATLILLRRVVLSPWFEAFFTSVILGNAFIIALETQYYGIDAGYQIGYAGAHQSAADAWPGAEQAFKGLDYLFGVLFTIEVVLKVFAQGGNYLWQVWNWFDCVIVAIWYVTLLVQVPLDTNTLRLLRLMKLLRITRLIKTIHGFDSLYLMTTSIRGSFSALGWAAVLLLLVEMMIVLVLNQMLEGYILDESKPLEQRKEVFRFFGTFSKGILTMFEITLANWAPVCRTLTEHVSEWYTIFSLLHKFLIGFAVVMVITGVILQETFKVASSDDNIMMNQRERTIKTHTRKIENLFSAADKDESGYLDRNEFSNIINDPIVKTWLAAMGLEVSDVDTVFTLVDTGADGQLTAKELVEGVDRLKGTARSLDLAVVMHENRELRGMIQDVLVQLEQLNNSGHEAPEEDPEALAGATA